MLSIWININWFLIPKTLLISALTFRSCSFLSWSSIITKRDTNSIYSLASQDTCCEYMLCYRLIRMFRMTKTDHKNVVQASSRSKLESSSRWGRISLPKFSLLHWCIWIAAKVYAEKVKAIYALWTAKRFCNEAILSWTKIRVWLHWI